MINKAKQAALVVLQKTARWITWRALAEEAADAVVAGGAVEARGLSTIVDVLRTIWPRPSVDANTREASVRVRTRGAVLAHARPERALVDVLVAVRARERWRTLASVRIDAVHASGAVLTQMTRTVVDVLLAIHPGEA